jgi:hypothetical protein
MKRALVILGIVAALVMGLSTTASAGVGLPATCGATAPVITAIAPASVTVYTAGVQPCWLGTPGAPGSLPLTRVTIWAKWEINGALVGGLTAGIHVLPYTAAKTAKFKRPAGATAVWIRVTYTFSNSNGTVESQGGLFTPITALP